MDIKDRVMGDQPNDFFHKIAGIVPGYHGYTDRERRRDADKILRTTLAHQFSAQRDRLTRVQQSLLRGHHLEEIAEIDRLAGALQRFTDRLSMATYGYSGLFDPIKVEAADLDQLYAFDMALASGVDQVSSAVGAVDAAATSPTGPAGMPELPAAISRLSSLLDDLNQRLNERADLLTSGKRLPDSDYRALLSDMRQPPQEPPSSQYLTPNAGAMSPDNASASMAQSISNAGEGGSGTPTTNLTSQVRGPSDPALASLVGDDQSLTPMSAEQSMSAEGAPLPQTQIGAAGSAGRSGSGIETSSSPVSHPGAPGADIVKGLEMTPGSALESTTEGIDTGANLGNPGQISISPDNPKP